MRTRAGLVVFAFCIATCLLSCAHKETLAAPLVLDPAEEEWLQEYRGKLLFAPDPYYAPFEYYDEAQGGTMGLMHDYLRLVEGKLDIKLVRVQLDSFEQILSLARARHLALVNAVTQTPERSEFLDFTEPLVQMDNVILVRKDQAPAVDLESLEGLKVAMVKGYAVTEFVQSKYPDIQMETVASDLQALLAVSYGLADAAIIDLATASWLTQKQGLSNLKVSGNAHYPVRLAIASRNDWPILSSILAKATAAITPEEKQAILNKWLILENTQKTQLRNFYLVLMALVGIFLVVGGFMLLWNRQLAHRIARRTASLDKALAEKETLVLELHHRTNNALNVISSMVQMEIATTPEAISRQVLQNILNRTMAMGLVYQKLDGVSGFTHIDLAIYLPELATRILEAHDSITGQNKLALDLAPASVPYDIAIPCGFILCELVSYSVNGSRTMANSGTMAGSLTGHDPASLAISLRHSGDHGLILAYTDSGLSHAVPLAGQDLLVMTAEHQLQGRIQFSVDQKTGLTCTIQFQDNVYAGRI